MKTFKPKLFEVFQSYSKKQLISDLVAGIIVAGAGSLVATCGALIRRRGLIVGARSKQRNKQTRYEQQSQNRFPGFHFYLPFIVEIRVFYKQFTTVE